MPDLFIWRLAGCWLGVLALVCWGLKLVGIDGFAALCAGIVLANLVTDRVVRP